MALVTKIREWRDVPHEPGNRFRIQKLSWKQLEDAEDAAQGRAIEKMNRYSADIYKVLRDGRREEAIQALGGDEDEVEAAAQDPLAGYDVFTLLRHGLIDWEGPEYGDKLTDQARQDLDDETKDWAAREIMRLAKPELFADDEDDEPGNGSISSTSSLTPIVGSMGPRTASS